jgi:K+/H+ antiporter YhaU regulatory subunit KhtT
MKKNIKLKDRFQYYFENTISTGSVGIIKWLAIFSSLIILLLGLIIVLFGITNTTEPNAESLGFIEGSWQSLMATLDAGTMGGDQGWSYRLVRFIASLGGIFIISILIGSISSSIDEKINQLKKGHSKVLEVNHTLILGWSEKIFSIIREIIDANENQKKQHIVILADKDKEEMEDEIRSKILNFKTTKVIVRSGSPLELSDIEVVNPNDAKSIIVLSPSDKNGDIHVIKSVLALTNNKTRKKEKFKIVAEIKNKKNMEAAELAGNNEAVFVLSSDNTSRIIAQTCLQSGLSIVYNELLKFEGDEIYFQEEPKLVGKTYKEILFSYEDSSIIGIITNEKEVLLNPAMETIFEEKDSVIAISKDDDTVILSKSNNFKINKEHFNKSINENKNVEKTLILGWNDKGYRIVEELDNYVPMGSEITVVAENIENEKIVDALESSLINQKLNHINGDITDNSTLVGLGLDSYSHIIVLSYFNVDIQESDAKTLICLLHLRKISEKLNKNFCIVSEMLDVRNREIGIVAKADDFIVSDNIISLILSQLSENNELKKVYDVLFEAEGSEIYLKPVSNYIKTKIPVNFYTILDSAANQGETAIGYRISAQASYPEKNFGVKINPTKDIEITFFDEDFIIVLAEN